MLKYISIVLVIVLLAFTGAIAELEDEFDLMIPDEESEKVISSSFRSRYPNRIFNYRTQVENWWINTSYFWNSNFFGDTMFWDDVFIFDSDFVINENDETYFMWDISKSAFRAGLYEGTQLDTIGSYSYSLGLNSEAKGTQSFSIGTECESNVRNSFSFGNEAVANDTNCISMGYQTKASKEYSTALGNNSKTWDYGQISHSNGTGWNYSTNYTLSKAASYPSGNAQNHTLELLSGLSQSKEENITLLDTSLVYLTGTVIGTTEGADSAWIYEFETACTFTTTGQDPTNVYESIITIAEADTAFYLDLLYMDTNIYVRAFNDSGTTHQIRWNANVEGNFVQFK